MDLKTKVEKVGNRIVAVSQDVLLLSDDYYNSTSMSENVDEKYVLDVFQKLQNLDRFNIKSNFPLINLIKSLIEYETAMKEYSRLFIFKHLFNALELAINFSQEITGDDFDNAVEVRAGIPRTSVTRWRDFYNRTKHVDRSDNHNITYLEGTQKVSSMILPVRHCTKKAITTLLNSNWRQKT